MRCSYRWILMKSEWPHSVKPLATTPVCPLRRCPLICPFPVCPLDLEDLPLRKVFWAREWCGTDTKSIFEKRKSLFKPNKEPISTNLLSNSWFFVWRYFLQSRQTIFLWNICNILFFCKKSIKCELNTINVSCLRWLEWDWWKWWKWWKQEIVNHRLDQLRKTCSKVADTVSDFIPYLEYICTRTLPFLLSSSCIYAFTMTFRWL